MDQIPAAMDRHLDVLQCHAETGGILLGASNLTGRYWFGSLWYYDKYESIPDVEKCTAGVQLEAGITDAKWVDSTKVVVSLDTGGLALWELIDNYHTFVLRSTAIEHDDTVNSVSVSSDHKNAVSCSSDCRIKTWDLENLSSTHCYRGHKDSVVCVDYHSKEKDLFLSASTDGNIILWDMRKPKPASIVDSRPSESSPTCVAWQPESNNMAAFGDELGRIVVKDLRMCTESHKTIIPHNRLVHRLAFSPKKPNLLASISEDCRTVIMSIDDNIIKPLYNEIKHTDYVHGISWYNEDIITCAWDSNVVRHCIQDQRETNQSNSESIVMEVNSDIPDKQDIIENTKHTLSNESKSKTEGKG
ncbi:hypothetical protein LOTGIDRAFT_195693 [Lottia gigantea]|uniref:Uncharacterized protein n=1 Tax=Lottia gigantea TaxID=225164 RepID=V3ZT88_LOTGI|nr:hypothetical protein LOTGIDRAFT_195693 [Lottia gigantea]ESO85780.1 hypothetical protein LOTGIDRAFT_195693 [Lottia gigantea]